MRVRSLENFKFCQVANRYYRYFRQSHVQHAVLSTRFLRRCATVFLLVLTFVCGNVLSRFPDSSHRSRFSSHLYFRNVFAQLERHRTKTIGKRYFLRSDSSQQTARALRVVSASSYDASSWCGSSGHPRRTPLHVQSDRACALPQRRLRPLSCRVSQV